MTDQTDQTVYDDETDEPTDRAAPPSRGTTVVVFAGGEPMAAVAGPPPAADYVIAADSGLDQAHRLGYAVDLVLGDFDSVSAAGLAAAEAAGAAVERHPVAKDATDLELALDAALARHPDEIVVIGGHGGRVDHFLAGALALTRDESTAVDVRAVIGPARLHVVRRSLRVGGRPGELLTLLAVRGPVGGVTTGGLLYPLRGETLRPGSTRGVSNQLTGEWATVDVASGVLLAVLPGELGPDLPDALDVPDQPIPDPTNDPINDPMTNDEEHP
jgi:thiamine pyrophosphokinase